MYCWGQYQQAFFVSLAMTLDSTKPPLPNPLLLAPEFVLFKGTAYLDPLLSVGHPQTCVDPDVCLGIAHVSGKASRDKGFGRYTMYLPLSPQGICRAKRADTLCIYQTPCPERGTLPDGQSLNTHQGKHRSGGAQECWFRRLSAGFYLFDTFILFSSAGLGAYHWGRNYYILYSEKIKSCKETALQ